MSFDCYDARSFRRQRIKEVAIALGLSTAISLIAIFAHPAKAEARPRHHHSQVADANGNDPRPRAWCGWWLRQYLGVKDRAGNLARWWADFGTRASGPAVGVIGSSAMPHRGQVPGPTCRISGCIGQVYFAPGTTGGGSAAPWPQQG